jgi:hypothetical protein
MYAVVGHVYYFLDYVFPQVAEVRGWRIKKLLYTPVVLHYLCGLDHAHSEQGFVVRLTVC